MRRSGEQEAALLIVLCGIFPAGGAERKSLWEVGAPCNVRDAEEFRFKNTAMAR